MTHLGSSFNLNGLAIKNRTLRSATMENMADIGGYVTDSLLKVYYDLARGGVGLIITGAAAVDPAGQVFDHQMAAWDDAFIEGLARIAKIIHTCGDGCACAVQLHYGAGPGRGYRDFGSASLVDAPEPEIEKVIRAFAEAALRVKKSGFDAVQVHGAHSYVVSQFLSPLTNTRTDKWGGSAEGRMRFAVEICRAIRAEIGDGMPLLWKINCADYLEGGIEPDASAQVAARLIEEGSNLIEISGGVKDMLQLRARLKRRAGEKEAYFLDAVETFRKAIGDNALALTGGIRSLAVMENLLNTGVDFIGLCRPLISEPDLPNRLIHTADKRKARCTSCSKCSLQISKWPVKCVEFDEFSRILKQI